jgi:hypothetical protein
MRGPALETPLFHWREAMNGVRNPLLSVLLDWIAGRLEKRFSRAALTH